MAAPQPPRALRTIAEVQAAGAALAAGWPPPSQAVVNACAAILAPWQDRLPQAA